MGSGICVVNCSLQKVCKNEGTVVDDRCRIRYIVVSFGLFPKATDVMKKTKSQRIDWEDINVKVAIAYGVAIIAFLLMLVVFKVV